MGFLEERDLSGCPTIPEFYKGKTIFITGGSGFIGKVLIEKLLYSCTELNKIYLLLRSKKNVKPEDRLTSLYSSHCFDRLRSEKPEIFGSKVFVVSGDVMEPGLGLSPENRELLINEVDIIFHIAASVRFDDPLKYAIRMNLKGTLDTIALAKEVKKLCAFVHISTSYSNTNRDPIEEVLYPPLADWKDTLAICESVDDHTLRILTPKYLGEIPNTYTFTKQLAEHVVSENMGKLPVVIVRPSIVISSLSEPMPGWVENFNGPVGIFVACGKGIMRTIHTKPDIVSDFIPVDACAKNIAAAAWIRGTKSLDPTDDVPIYNCCAGQLNILKMYDLVKIAKDLGSQVPLNGLLWTVGGKITTNAKVHYFKVLVQHLLPAIIVDIILWLLGKKPMLVKIQRRIYIADLALRYYTTQQWTFDNKNFVALRSSLKEEDRDSFYYKLENIDIPTFMRNGCLGGRRYLLKEKDEDLPSAKVHCRRMAIVDKVFQFLFYGAIFYWMFKKVINYYEYSTIISG
uniref:Fatty acyl-CoA reductase n=1 Tax=Hyphantria cunea TaxID=39466 RepID=A0A5S9HFE9_HYPCU|nr:fatty acyl-CoA reductase [Hyphantria cunea]